MLTPFMNALLGSATGLFMFAIIVCIISLCAKRQDKQIQLRKIKEIQQRKIKETDYRLSIIRQEFEERK
ncbi:Oidioi.mRNA.OKI2018_I69.chr1.g1208.t1.cds [Oikopleura dioica]|uniref:Oidioi.mRNA.OKI2018_I69.chr1.g1208.t1.cds n=1 Tax=Oikopleura dioica TaxID=34765 RepID=A0ABN7SWE9_OIKDI|nr:Oidioi.mRNA.OKI2018_I69.chr1.g1208.t1.cds [Oikopleura dioica]